MGFQMKDGIATNVFTLLVTCSMTAAIGPLIFK